MVDIWGDDIGKRTEFDNPQIAPPPITPQFKAPPVLLTPGKSTVKGPPHRLFVADIRPAEHRGTLITVRATPTTTRYAQWQEQQARGRSGSQPPPSRAVAAASTTALEGSFKRLDIEESANRSIDGHGVLDRG